MRKKKNRKRTFIIINQDEYIQKYIKTFIKKI